MKENKKVAIIAVAKNESIYFVHWIAHHLFFGFEEFVIGVNRSNDSSNEVLSEISKKVNLKYESVDWIDQTTRGDCERIQTVSYAYLQTKLSPDITDVIFLDIDEFWFPLDFKTNIKDLLSKSKYDLLSFNWFCLAGEESEFSPPFSFQKGKVNQHVKTLFNLKKMKDVDVFRCHTPLIKNGKDFVHIVPDGSPHIPKGGELSDPKSMKGQEYYILHRMCRSEVEYLALLLRSRPKNDFRLKTNRNGFDISCDSDLFFSVPDEYFKYISCFEEDVSLSDTLSQEIKKKKEVASTILSVGVDEIESNLSAYCKALRGTKEMRNLCEKVYADSDNADTLRDLAIFMENNAIDISYKLMLKANSIRPEGKRIINKIKQYNRIRDNR